MKVYIVIFLVLLSSCITFKSESVFDKSEVAKNEVCVTSNFSYIDSTHKPTPMKLPEGDEIRLRKGLEVFGVNTNCANPRANFDILIEEQNAISIPEGIWLGISFGTLGIVPFFHDSNVRIEVREKEHLVVADHYSAKQVISIIYVFKMFSDDSIATEKFKTKTRTEAEFSYTIAQAIHKALSK